MIGADELWNERMSVGVEQLDDHHRTLIRLMLECRDAIGAGYARDELKGILAALVSYGKYHFLAEERFMVEIGYPLIESQRAAHRQFSEKLEDLVSAYSLDPKSFKRELLGFMKDWFVEHIIGQDALIGAYARERAENRG